MRGRDSLINPAAGVPRLAARCRRAGLEVQDVVVEGRHALWQSLPDVAGIARETRKGRVG